MAITFRIAVLAGFALISACGTVGAGDGQSARGIGVTRFHLGGQIARGEVAVEPRFATQAAGGVYLPAFAGTIASELRTLGFTSAATPATSEFVATVDVATGTRVALAARAPAAARAAAPANPNATATQLAVQLKRRSDGSIIWEGRAQAAARASSTASAATVQKLARALFRDFPGESGRTINVR